MDMTHMMDDPVVAMMLMVGLVVVLAVGFLAVRLYGARQRTPHVPLPAEATALPAVTSGPERPSLEQ